MPRTSWHAFSSRVKFLAGTLLVVMVAGWVAWFAPFDDLLDRSGTPLGADFSMFYAAGRVANGSPANLYSQAEHQQQLRELFTKLDPSFCLPYRYPPLVATLMSNLSQLPYPIAYCLFLVASAVLWGLTIGLLLREFFDDQPQIRRTLAWALVGWPVAIETLMGGQASMFTVAIATSTLLMLRRNRPLEAGAILALALFKPNVLGLFAIGLVCRYPRMLLGLIPAAATLLAISCATTGWDSVEQYIRVLLQLGSGPWDVETPFWKLHSLSVVLQLLAGEHARLIALCLGITFSLTIGILWRRSNSDAAFPGFAAALLGINALFNPYTPIYDLLLLGPAVILGSAVAYRNPSLANPHLAYTVFGMLFFGPHLSQTVATQIGFQVFPLVVLLTVSLGWCNMQIKKARSKMLRSGHVVTA